MLLCHAQVTEECKERGELMADVWIAHTTILETVMTRMHQLCLEDRDRWAICLHVQFKQHLF